ncbi:MAG: hypothetical protein ACREMP_03735 [Candidatus Tyrphobacter sp.]
MTFRKRAIGAFIACAYLFSLLGAPALAQHVLPVLGTAPLLGAMNSTAELQERVSQRHAMFVTAALDLGLSSSETAELVDQIMSGRVRWVRIPRHLDAMTWAWDGSVYMYRDVVIPADEWGWETDIHAGPNVHALFIPAACGNLSLVERSAPIAYIAPPPPPPSCPSGLMGNPPNCYPPPCPAGMTGTPPNCYAPAPQCPPGMMVTPQGCYAPCQTEMVNGICPTPPPQLTVVVKTNVREVVAWWLIPVAFLGFFFGGHYHHSPPPPPPPPVRCPPGGDPP